MAHAGAETTIWPRAQEAAERGASAGHAAGALSDISEFCAVASQRHDII
jgi:hypothetical protein